MELPKVRDADSIHNLLKDLGEVYTSDVRHARSVVYGHLLSKNQKQTEDRIHWLEDFANYCYNLRFDGFYDDTNCVEDLVTQLENEEACDGIMKFLTLLSGSRSHKNPGSGFIPSHPTATQPHHILPDQNNCYHRDTCVIQRDVSAYTLYRDSLFEAVQTCPDIEQTQKMVENFPITTALSRFIRPGSDKLAIMDQPCNQDTSDNRRNVNNEVTYYPGDKNTLPAPRLFIAPHLFSSMLESGQDAPKPLPILADLPALPPPTVTGIFKTLSHNKQDLTTTYTSGPVVKSDVKPRFAPNLNEPTQRFVAVRPAAVSCAVSDSSGIESDMEDSWELAFQDMDKEFPDPTYELLGKKIKQERPYLSEAGPEVYTKLCLLLCSPYTDIRVVTEQHVLYQCQFVLLGVPTSLFRYDQIKVEFVPVQSICCVGISPDSLVDALYSIAYSGTLYLRLKMFCEKYGAVERFGNIVKGLVGGVQQYLYLYQMFLNQLQVTSLLQLLWKIKTLTSQLEFLCNLLLLDEGLPTGIPLLNYLYKMSEILSFSPHCKVMLALLRGALTPYVKFLELWLCEGKVWDDWAEYHIVSNQEWLNNKDYLFWQYGYTWREGSPLPGFLTDMYEQLLNTGRLMNLFRQCIPDHPLSISKIATPKINITFNDRDISRNLNKWHRYKKGIESELRTQSVVRKMKIKEVEDRRMAQIAASREDSRRRIAMIMEEAGQLQDKAAQNKRETLQNLQEQMMERAEQRADQIERERKEDKQRIEISNTEQYELVAKVREQLEDYYKTLNEETARKERRSLWRIHRMKLNRLRKAYLTLEQHNWNNELRSFIQTGSILENVSIENIPQESSISRKTWIRPENIDIATESSLTTTPTLPTNTAITPKNMSTPETAMENKAPTTSPQADIIPHIKQDALSKQTANNQPETVTKNKVTTTQPSAGSIEDTTSKIPEEIQNEDNVQEISEDGAKSEHQTSDDDSEISFELPTEIKDNKNVRTDNKTIPKNETGDDIKSEIEKPQTTNKPSHESVGQAKDIIYPPVNNSNILPSEQPKKYEPEGQIQELLYSTSSKNDPQTETQYEPDGQMKDILYGKHPTPTPSAFSSNHPDSGQDMKDLLYFSESTSGSTESPTTTQYEPAGQMKELLYGTSSKTDDQQERSYEPAGNMNELIYGASASGNLPERRYEPVGQMKELLYGSSPETSGESTGKGAEVEVSKTAETRVKPGTRGLHEPKGKMWELLYGTTAGSEDSVDMSEKGVNTVSYSYVEDDSGYVDYVEPIRLSYPELDARPNPYIMTERLTKYCVVEDADLKNADIETCRSLEITLKRMIEQPLLLQMKLVNNAALEYFFDHLDINGHFDNLRSYIFMNNGMFGDTLAKTLFTMIEYGVDITESSAMLNSVLHSAMEASSKIEERLSLETVPTTSDNVLDSLVLKYNVDWPSNIIISDETLYKYNEIFRFLIKLKHCCFTLDKIWFTLSSVDKKSTSPQIRKLQICRYEVSQCLHTVQIYITHQLHNISWHELQNALKTVDSLSELQALHERYLDQSLERLLLGEQTKAPYEILLKIFKHIGTFSKLLESHKFTPDVNGNLTHPHFNKLMAQHLDFEKQASFILMIAESSNKVGYKPYIDEFILRLDFNHYYESKTASNKRNSLGIMRRVSNDKLRLSGVFSSPSTSLS